MKLIIPDNESAPFLKAWASSLKSAPRGARIASLEELALARVSAKKPHAPGKPWETYADGTSPLWERWIMTSSCVLIGMAEGEPTLLIAHGLAPSARGGRRSAKHFTFQDDAWSRLLEETPASRRMPLAAALAICRGDTLTASAMLNHKIMVAAFGPSLETYADAHRAIASEHLWHALSHHGEYAGLTDEQKRLVADPPIIDLDFGRLAQSVPEVPRQGAIGWYLVLENLQKMGVEGIRHRCTRLSQLSLSQPDDDAKFLVVID